MLYDKSFHRLFSLNFYKDLKLKLGELSFGKDFISEKKGDIYPIINNVNADEKIEYNQYVLYKGKSERLIGAFFPYATYELNFKKLKGSIGFGFYFEDKKADIIYEDDKIYYKSGNVKSEFKVETQLSSIIVTCRPSAFDIYTKKNGVAYYICTFNANDFEDSAYFCKFSKAYVTFKVAGNVTILSGSFYIDCGISQADIRPIRYENGSPYIENGKVFLTISLRLQEQQIQGILSWVPGTSEFSLTGVLFFDAGDGLWANDVASSIIFNRISNKWNLWVPSFNHGHILGCSSFLGDPRFGVNVIDIKLMNKKENSQIDEFFGMEGDEDPDFIYNEKTNTWYMAICRLDPKTGLYRYVFFESDQPFDNYKHIGTGVEGCETGGSFQFINDELNFICGNSFDKISDYRIYDKNGMHQPTFDFPDGGFRGWGSVVPITFGSRTKYYWLTFDRSCGSEYNWSYGNLYCFVSD